MFGFPPHRGRPALGRSTSASTHQAAWGEQLADAAVMARSSPTRCWPCNRTPDPPSWHRNSTQQSANTPSMHEAAGMISVQLGVTVDEALVRLRARESSQPAGALHVVRTWAGVLLGLDGRAEETRRMADHRTLRPLERCVLRPGTRRRRRNRDWAQLPAPTRVRQASDRIHADPPHGRRAGSRGTAATGAPDPEVARRWRRPRRDRPSLPSQRRTRRADRATGGVQAGQVIHRSLLDIKIDRWVRS